MSSGGVEIMLRRCVEQQRISLSEHFGGARAGGAFLPRREWVEITVNF